MSSSNNGGAGCFIWLIILIMWLAIMSLEEKVEKLEEERLSPTTQPK